MDPFLANCGAVSLEVTVERAGAASQAAARVLERPYLMIGRDPRCDLALDDRHVSRRHAYLQAVGGRLYCIDLDSRTGVHWPSGRRTTGWVDWGEPLRVGKTVLRVSRPRPDDAAGALPSEEDVTVARPAPKVAFEVIEGTNRPVCWEMNRLLALAGASARCKVRLRDARVSRFHCALVRGPLGVWVVDLLSRTGTQVNGRPVTQTRLEDGDLLQVGPYVLRVRYQATSRPRTMLVAPTSAPAGRALVPATSALAPPPDKALLLPLFNEFQQMQQQMMGQFQQTLLMMAEMFSTLHKEQSALVREELEHLRKLTGELTALQAEKARQALPAPAAPLPANGTTAGGPTPAAAPDGKGKAEAAPGIPKETPAAPPADVHDWLSRRIDALQAERQGRWQKLLQAVMGH